MRLLPRSLTGRLVVAVVTLVAVVSGLVGAATTVVMRDYLEDQLDAKVVDAARRAGVGEPPEMPGRFDGGRFGDDGPLFGNQEPGTLIAYPSEGTGQVLAEQFDEGVALEEAALDRLADVPVGGQVHEVSLPGQGSYRVVASTDDGGRTLVVGLPTDQVDEAVGSLVRLEVALALLAVVAAAAAAVAVVRRQLRPLTEVAATAHAVSELPLSAGEVGVTERVPDHLTDPQTEVGQVGHALNTLLEHVETALSARHRSEQQVRQFVADASHELRTPLTTIAGYTELARRRQDEPTNAAALAKVEEEAARMTALVEDLLLLARLDAGRPLAQEPVDLTRLLLEAVDDARVLAPEHHWRLVLPDAEEPVEVTGDETRLHQVVTNLLTNARKHTPPGTTVTVEARPDGFEVRDDGPGFPPELVATAFERFTRGDSARHREGGVGLGLALVAAIVGAHGGTVSLDSRRGDTRIRVSLPGTT